MSVLSTTCCNITLVGGCLSDMTRKAMTLQCSICWVNLKLRKIKFKLNLGLLWDNYP